MGKLKQNLIGLKWQHDNCQPGEEEKPETHQGLAGGWKASSPSCFWVGSFVLFSVHEINTSKCFLAFHLFIPAINILSLKKGSNARS